MPYLEAAMSTSIEDISFDVEKATNAFCIQDTIQPMRPGNLSILFLQCQKLKPGMKMFVSGW
jgi:hypothetical protein